MSDDKERHYDTLKYIGRELKREGEKNDKKWKIFRLKFDVGGNFPKGFDCFDSLFEEKEGKEKLVLEEGTTYVIGYNKNMFKSQHSPDLKEGRTVFYMKEASEEDIQDIQKSKEEKNTVTTEEVIVKRTVELPKQDDIETFYQEYKANVGDKAFNKSTFTLTWFANQHNEEYEKVMGFAKSDHTIDLEPIPEEEVKKE